jgi:hypothetical protein
VSKPKEGGVKDRLAAMESWAETAQAAIAGLNARVIALEMRTPGGDPRVDVLQASALQDARGTADNTAPHGHHTADGPPGCPKCGLIREGT